MGVFVVKKWKMRVFCRKVENGGVFIKKVENEGCFFVKKVGKGGGVVKKWTFPQRRVHYVQYQYFFYFTFYLFGGCVRIQRTLYGPDGRDHQLA